MVLYITSIAFQYLGLPLYVVELRRYYRLRVLLKFYSFPFRPNTCIMSIITYSLVLTKYKVDANISLKTNYLIMN